MSLKEDYERLREDYERLREDYRWCLEDRAVLRTQFQELRERHEQAETEWQRQKEAKRESDDHDCRVRQYQADKIKQLEADLRDRNETIEKLIGPSWWTRLKEWLT